MVVAGNSCFLLDEGCELMVAASCLVVGGCWYEAYSPVVTTQFFFDFLDVFYDCVYQAKAAIAVFEVVDDFSVILLFRCSGVSLGEVFHDVVVLVIHISQFYGLNFLFLFSFAKVLWAFEMMFHSLYFPYLQFLLLNTI